MSGSDTLTIRLDATLKARLEALAKSTRRTKSFLAAEAIAAFVDANAWQVAEIESAVQEADAGDFASDTDVQETFAKWAE